MIIILLWIVLMQRMTIPSSDSSGALLRMGAWYMESTVGKQGFFCWIGEQAKIII